jgi:hypothetical protein
LDQTTVAGHPTGENGKFAGQLRFTVSRTQADQASDNRFAIADDEISSRKNSRL